MPISRAQARSLAGAVREARRRLERDAARVREPRAIAIFALFLSSAMLASGLSSGRGMKRPTEDRTMTSHEARASRAVALGAVAIVALAGSASAQAIEWRAEDGGNGHWYAAVLVAQSRAAMIQLAASQGADPVAISTMSEQDFVSERFGDGSVLGLYAPGSSNGFTWMNGEPVAFTCWGSASCPAGPYPNNSFHFLERFVAMSDLGGCGNRWDDYPRGQLPDPFSLVLEWSADCDANGLVDYGEIVRGAKSDSDGDNVPDCCEAGVACACIGDVDANALVDAIDLAIVLERWGAVPKDYPRADVNGDGAVDAADLSAVLFAWGACGG